MRSIIMSVAVIAMLAFPADAASVGGVNLEDTVTVGNQTLVLNGAGIRKKLFIKVYVGALYLPARQTSERAVLAADSPRRMVLHFLYDVEKAKLAEAWQEGLAANTPGAPAEVKKAFQTLSSWMEDVATGQRIVLTYIPGTGTTVEVNGKAKGTLPGKAVADAILATWIGPKPGPGEEFKKAVLGR
ncbi:MAG TPA: chalcone isomerase family protein [Thermoanaerobaculia bacterium]|nr:chalcone isomerase family protein [Thermoanaerobaculia bacterium]